MKQHFKILTIALSTILVAFILPQLVRADAPVSLSAYGREGHVRLEWQNSVDTQVYSVTSYKIYRGMSAGFTPNGDSLMIQVYNPQANYFEDYNIAPKQNYYYVVSAVDEVYGEFAFSNQATALPTGRQPHGFYDNKTTKCSVCHSGHTAKAGALVNTELTTMVDLCKICHESGGESSLTIEPVKAYHSSQNCNQCHNPHGNNKNQKFVPRLLQVTIGGKVYFEANNPETGVGNGFCLVSQCHVNYPGFKYEPPVSGEGHDSLAMINNQLPDGEVSATGITCIGCHQKHGSNLPKVLRQQVNWNSNSYLFADGYNIFTAPNEPHVANYNGFCGSCHEPQYKGWPGITDYNNSSFNQHDNVACYECHDPHGIANRSKYLKEKYTREVITGDTIDNNFKLCFNSCHSSTALTSTNEVTTKFSLNSGEASVNLHVYHLENTDSSKRAVCRDCHRPHGTSAAENSERAKNIGFPSSYNQSVYLAAYDYARPNYINQTSGGACNLVCHNVKHTEENYGDEGIYSVYSSVY